MIKAGGRGSNAVLRRYVAALRVGASQCVVPQCGELSTEWEQRLSVYRWYPSDRRAAPLSETPSAAGHLVTTVIQTAALCNDCACPPHLHAMFGRRRIAICPCLASICSARAASSPSSLHRCHVASLKGGTEHCAQRCAARDTAFAGVGSCERERCALRANAVHIPPIQRGHIPTWPDSGAECGMQRSAECARSVDTVNAR